MNHEVTNELTEYLAYVGFDDEDRRRLRDLLERLTPSFPAIATKFYDAVLASPGAAAVLRGPEQIERLRTTLIEWMATGLRGPYDDAFYEKRSRIGRRHVQIGLAQQYMFTAMSVVRTAYHDAIATLYPADEALRVVRSVDKLFDLELALMLRHYQLDSEEKLVARERAMQADRLAALQTMTAGLAHEVRNPLNAARLQLELLERRLRKAGDDPRLLEPTELANHEMARLTNLLNDFLAFARAPELHLCEQDVVTIVRHVIELEREFAARSKIDLVHDEAVATLTARVDPGKLHQVVQNIVRNAIEAAHARVEVAIVVEGGAMHIRVVDDGPGIPEDVRRRMFEPFYSTKPHGTGLGMSIAHTLVAMHGGRIEVATGARGTRIEIVVPITTS